MGYPKKADSRDQTHFQYEGQVAKFEVTRKQWLKRQIAI